MLHVRKFALTWKCQRCDISDPRMLFTSRIYVLTKFNFVNAHRIYVLRIYSLNFLEVR